MLELYPFLSYVSVVLAFSSYVILNRNIQNRKLQESQLLGVIGVLKEHMEVLEKRIENSTSQVIVKKQTSLEEEIHKTNGRVSEQYELMMGNTVQVSNTETKILACQKKIKSLEHGLSLVNSILESSATIEKPKATYSLW